MYRVYFPKEKVLCYVYSNGMVEDISLGMYTKENLVDLFLGNQHKK